MPFLELDQDVVKLVLEFEFSEPSFLPASITNSPKVFPSCEFCDCEPADFTLGPASPRCSLENLVEDLQHASFSFEGGSHRERIDPQRKGETYHTVRFAFLHQDWGSGLALVRDSNKLMFRVLQGMCATILWRVTIFVNPCKREGSGLPVAYSICIKLEGGEPKPVSESPIPPRADFDLCVLDNHLVLTDAQ